MWIWGALIVGYIAIFIPLYIMLPDTYTEHDATYLYAQWIIIDSALIFFQIVFYLQTIFRDQKKK